MNGLAEENNMKAQNKSNTKTVLRRRRVRGSGVGQPAPVDENDASSESEKRSSDHRVMKGIGVRDPVAFVAAAEEFIIRAERALRPMQRCNEVFDIVYTPREEGTTHIHEAYPEEEEEAVWGLSIHLQPGDGMYKMEVNERDKSIFMQSPISGGYTYVLCQRTGEW
eukprot:CAMPEP_0195514728 /NCGR_PEP_ID=MMETSP0794_2-20130614/6021_1 /TAXON_ID=515487 /ORGANISM="Stephanopyxis turris, Strain CCMP 815" /LENGTH=165 /DNA_ID=CAMNT_0040643019 /DNA_START=367 /DNA_END=861 /DNA_ORIENTATION=-